MATTHQQSKAQTPTTAPPAASRQPAPAPVQAPDVPALHDAIGNRAVGSLLEGGGVIQRKCAACASGGTTCSGCAEEELQRAAAPGAPAPSSLPPAVTDALSAGGGRSLDGDTRAFMESRFGNSFGAVRVHTGDEAARAADAIGALAFTVGSSIWFGRGAYNPSDPEGLHLLAHELTHTVQQRGTGGAAQANLRVGSVSDPAEFAADRAADAVLAGRPLSRIGASGPAIRRKPKVSPVAGRPDQREVVLDSGKKYRVTRHVDWVTTKTTKPEDELKFGAKISKERVWLQVDWCKETNRGNVQLGANVPGAAAQLLKDVGQEILRGGDPLPKLKGAEVEPFLGVVVAESRKFRLEAEATVKVKPGEGEVTGGGIKGRLKLPGVDITGEGTLNKPPEGAQRPGPDVRIIVGVEGTFGGPGKVQCKTVTRTTVEPRVTFSCEEFVPEHEEDKPTKVTLDKTNYLYFEYAKADFAKKASEPGAKRNPTEMAELRAAMKDGFKVVAISGHASPEGPLEPTKTFIGNIALAQARADAAKAWLEAECPKPSLLVMREPEPCVPPDLKASGQGELYSGGVEPELKGKKLAQTAVAGFETGEAEERHRTPEITKELEKRKGSPERQAEDVVYPLLRRAEVSLRKVETQMKPTKVPAAYNPASCPRDVLDAAEEDFSKSPPKKPNP